MPNKEGLVDGSYEDMMGGKGGLEGKGKKGKMGGRDDWLLKRGIWEKQVAPKKLKNITCHHKEKFDKFSPSTSRSLTRWRWW